MVGEGEPLQTQHGPGRDRQKAQFGSSVILQLGQFCLPLSFHSGTLIHSTALEYYWL